MSNATRSRPLPKASNDGATGPSARFGDVRTRGNPYRWTSDLYHWTIRAKWRLLLPVGLAIYLAINTVFACLYMLGDGHIHGAAPGSFGDAFFFSVQTISTIGYGGMTPATTWANVLVTGQAFIGMGAVALVTGLAFSKFSRPMAKIIFANRAVVHLRNGVQSLSFRAANSRGTDLVEAHMSVAILRTEISDEGQRLRRLMELKLVRDRSPVFLLSWAVMHTIDADSPLAGLTHADLCEDNAMIVCTLTGVDGTTGQAMTSRHVYHADQIDFDSVYVDVIVAEPDGVIVLDFAHFHETEAQVLAPTADVPAIPEGDVGQPELALEVEKLSSIEGLNDETALEPKPLSMAPNDIG